MDIFATGKAIDLYSVEMKRQIEELKNKIKEKEEEIKKYKEREGIFTMMFVAGISSFIIVAVYLAHVSG